MPFFVFTWSVCTSFSASTPCHTNTHTYRQDCRRLWLAQNTTHAGVITMQVDYSNYCVNSLVFPFVFFCLFFFPPNDKHCLLDWSNVTDCQTREQTRVNSNRIPWPPSYLYEGPDMFQSLVFYMCPSNVRNGGCSCQWLGLGLCSVWHSETCVRKYWDSWLATTVFFVFFFMSKCTQRATCTLQVHSRRGQSVHRQFFTFYWDCSVLLHCFSFSLTHGNSNPSVKTAPGFNSISDEGLLFWPTAHRQSSLWANHHLQLEKLNNRWARPCYSLWMSIFPNNYFHP